MFKDRKDAGEQLAERLGNLRGENPIVVVVPRGGVSVGAEIAKVLGVPIEVVISRKIGSPFNPEVAIGAVTPDGEVMLNQRFMKAYHVEERHLKLEISAAKEELLRRLKLYRQGQEPCSWEGRTVILVDDGIATGFTIAATIEYIKRQKPQKLILAIPVAPLEVAEDFRTKVDELVCLIAAEDFYAVGQFYQQFNEVPDHEVLALLKQYSC